MSDDLNHSDKTTEARLAGIEFRVRALGIWMAVVTIWAVALVLKVWP